MKTSPILFWVQLNPDQTLSINHVHEQIKLDYNHKYPVLMVDFPSNRILIVLPDGRLKYAETGAYIICDGIKGLPLTEEVVTVTTTPDFKVLSAEEYRALSAEEKKEYSKAKKEAGL